MSPTPTSTKTLTTSKNGTVVQTGDGSVKLGNGVSNGISSVLNGITQQNGSVHSNNNKINYMAGSATLGPRTRSATSNGNVKENGNGLNGHGPVVGSTIRSDPKLYNMGDVPLMLVWRNVIIFAYLHLAAVYGVYLWLSGQVMLKTFFWGLLFYCMSGWGITGGAHRYWAHKSFKAKTPLRLLLALMQTVAFQNSIWEWCRDHRVHHKFTETNADPHDARRGFFFSHIGWLLCRKHPEVKEKGKLIDMSDLEADPIVVFQKKHYLPLTLMACIIIPTMVPPLCWGEDWWVSLFFAAMFRYCITLHMTWLVNSAAHMWGFRPYDKSINPAENRAVAFWAFGEGWHNYHHVFPWDYKTAEIGQYQYNFTAAFIDFMALIGQAYDLKTVPKHIVEARVARTGDGTHPSAKNHDHHHHHENAPWGWGDRDIPIEDLEVTEVLYQKHEE